ncbi:MAG: valine--tRNA ligase [Candidatus Oxydemutatoraceae bacterium WSBS_2016_MAG_OTU14]
MDKTYNPQALEPRHSKHWEEHHLARAQLTGNTASYSIILPPPNITGTLHMGHAFQATVMDCLCRYQRMHGHAVLWQPGIDHAGIATQMVVERQLEKKGQTRQQLGREAFIEEVWRWKEHSGGTIKQQLKRLGTLLDWERECFTMDTEISQAVAKVFVDLYHKGLIYRGEKLVNWDPKLKTAISDLEVITEEESGHIWNIAYPLKDTPEQHIVVATTRPETLFGDTAVAVHPEDDRYKHLIGKKLCLPLTGREIEIIADEYVEADFGTGCVKITPAHDFNDYEVGLRHQLSVINIMNLDASLNENVPPAYQGLDRFEARKKILKELEILNLLRSVDDKKIMIPRGDRSGQIVEPLLTKQWFVSTRPLAEQALKVVANKDITFIPSNWEKTYAHWLENIQDWCISRQLWWGHQIPAWYDLDGNYYVGLDENTIRSDNKLPDELVLKRDEDVLDTWFSSALWPFVTLGWPHSTDALKQFYPTSVLVTGFDIIFFWVARMVMMGLECTGQIPFQQIYVHGLVLDPDGKKMSKSKGNVLDPIDLIDGISLEQLIDKRSQSLMQEHLLAKVKKKTQQQFPEGIPAYGTDALRFTFMAMASNNRDIRFDLKRIEGYRNFCNKLWNATRFLTMHCANNTNNDYSNNTASFPADHWIEECLTQLLAKLEKHYETYRFDLIAQDIYEFVWHDYCDWYLEFCKVAQADLQYTEAQKHTNQCFQIALLERILCLLHPLIPFITEELWQELKPLTQHKESSILERPYPTAISNPVAQKIIDDILTAKNIIAAIRRVRAEIRIPLQQQITLKIQGWNKQDKEHFEEHANLIQKLSKVSSVDWVPENEKLSSCALALTGALRLFIPIEGLVDSEQEVERLAKEINKTQKQLERIKKLLSNEKFVAQALEEVVESNKIQLSTLRQRMDLLQLQSDALKK